jgi:hypothetical protein
MNRRDALKGMGLSLGYAVATPAILSMLQSCNTEASIWVPKFLTIDEGIVLRHLVDLILPQSETSPGALEVNVPEFIDLYVDKTYEDLEKRKYKKGLTSIMNALNINEERPLSKLKTEDYDALLAKYLKTDNKQQNAFKQDKEDTIIFKALTGIRSSSIWVYKTSELVGEQVLAYDPIPGFAKGCISVEEATGGKAWSL